MKLSESKHIQGKIVTFEDGTTLLLCSGGVGNETTHVMMKEGDGLWRDLSPRESLPYIVAIMHQTFGAES